jgi:hypothetical protein
MNQHRQMSSSGHSSFFDRWQSWQLMPLIYLILGGVIFIAQAIDGDIASGLVWFAVFAVISAVYAFGGRFEIIKQARGDLEDERDASINTRAMAAVGVVFVVLLTSCIVFELARGNNPSPYSQLMAVGGGSYIAALLVLRYRS